MKFYKNNPSYKIDDVHKKFFTHSYLSSIRSYETNICERFNIP